jgi:hypothetical protein
MIPVPLTHPDAERLAYIAGDITAAQAAALASDFEAGMSISDGMEAERDEARSDALALRELAEEALSALDESLDIMEGDLRNGDETTEMRKRLVEMRRTLKRYED